MIEFRIKREEKRLFYHKNDKGKNLGKVYFFSY